MDCVPIFQCGKKTFHRIFAKWTKMFFSKMSKTQNSSCLLKITSISSLIPLLPSILINSLLHNVGTTLQTSRNYLRVIIYIYSLQNVEDVMYIGE